MKFIMRVYIILIFFTHVPNCVSEVLGNETSLNNITQNLERIPVDGEKCIEGTPFVWCVPMTYNRIHEPWRDIPWTNSTFPWVYEFGLEVDEIQKINDEAQTITLSMYMTMVWKEPRLQINESSPDWGDEKLGDDGYINTMPQILDDLWQPDLYIFQLRKFTIRKAISKLSGLYIQKQKKIQYGAIIDITIGCSMSFDNYPLDTHECSFKVGSYNYFKHTVTCNSTYSYDKSHQRSLHYFVELEDLADKVDGDSDYANCGFIINLHRSRVQIFFQVYVISAMIVVVSWVTFVIPPDVVPARMGLLITIFLVLINIFNGVKTRSPVSTTLNAIDEYLMLCIILVFLALVEYTIVLARNKNPSIASKEPQKNGKVGRKVIPSLLEVEQTQHENGWRKYFMLKTITKCLDSFSLVMFPLTFLLLNVIYWSIYL